MHIHLIRIRRLASGLVVCVAVLALAACSGQTVPVPTPLVTAIPRPVPTLAVTISASPDCMPDTLDRWIKFSSANSDAFISLLNQSAGISAPQASGVANQLQRFRTLVGGLTVPKCAAAESQQVFSMMDAVLNGLTALGQGQKVELGNLIVTANTQYQQIKQAQQQLLNLLAQMRGHP